MIGEYKLATHVGGKGIFAKVRVQVDDAEMNSIVFDRCETPAGSPDSKPHYQAAVSFGIRWALEKLDRSNHWRLPRYEVCVLEIQTTAADSTEAAVFLAAANAVFHALQKPENALVIDRESFSIPIPLV